MQLTKEKYIIAGIITLVIFFLGIFMGFVLEQQRIQYAQAANEEQSVEFNSLQLQFAYINQLQQSGDCPKLIRTFDTTLKNLDTIRERVERFYLDARITKTEFERLRREYMISQLRYWVFSKALQSTCKTNHTRILYFYSTKEECPECGNQEFILNYLKKIYKENLLIFSLDTNLKEEQMITLLKDIYDVHVFPTLIVEDEKIEGLVTKDVLQERICAYYPKNFKDCASYSAGNASAQGSTPQATIVE